jgi:hypothetical protein
MNPSQSVALIKETVMALALLTLDQVKSYIPNYALYLQAASDAGDPSVDDLLTQEAEFAEAEFMALVPQAEDSADMTAAFTVHLVNMIRYRIFKIKHGDTKFERDPLVVVDYKRTIEKLEGGKVGIGRINMTTPRDRIMDEGFVESNDVYPKPTSVPFQD